MYIQLLRNMINRGKGAILDFYGVHKFAGKLSEELASKGNRESSLFFRGINKDNHVFCTCSKFLQA